MMETIIQISDLKKDYPGNPPVHALRGINLKIDPSAFVIITGPSGSGKSTLLNIIGTLDKPSHGRVVIAGADVNDMKGNALAEFRREKFGFIFQTFNLLPTLTALENVVLPLLPYKRKIGFQVEQRAKELLTRVGLKDRMGHLPGELSGGEQQRVAIARSLINSPSIILADEPTGNLDSENGDEVIQSLRNLNRQERMTVLLVTHNTSIIKADDQLIALKDGCEKGMPPLE